MISKRARVERNRNSRASVEGELATVERGEEGEHMNRVRERRVNTPLDPAEAILEMMRTFPLFVRFSPVVFA